QSYYSRVEEGSVAALRSDTWRRAEYRARLRLLQRLVGQRTAASLSQLKRPYEDGNNGCMKKTLHIDEQLLREARTASHASTDTEAVRLGLEALVRRAAYERLRALRGAEPSARDVPRRR